ncbi:MAG: hypothetical protein CSA81_14015 [Acidobacteria bacterium]|nr:MAG: hypothetical protein CSA81_14015 [Acidobacteriota bacterium]
MAIVRFKENEVPKPTQADYEAFDKIKDEDIDFSDISETDKAFWAGGVRGFENRHLLRNQLDNDISLWLAQQDNETKRQVNNVIRSFMAVCQHHKAAVTNKGEQHEYHPITSSG